MRKPFVILQLRIKQWGSIGEENSNQSKITLPIACASELYSVIISDTASSGDPLCYGAYNLSRASFYIFARRSISGDIESMAFGRWVAVGR